MYHRALIREQKARKLVVEQQAFRQNLRFLRIYYSFIKKNKKKLRALDNFKSKFNLKGRSYVKGTCIVTGASRSLLRIGVNRMQVRSLMEIGVIKGLKKYYW